MTFCKEYAYCCGCPFSAVCPSALSRPPSVFEQISIDEVIGDE